MAEENQKRPEATHRQRAALGAPGVIGWPVDADGNPMAIVTGTASDLVPTVQFGNLMVGPVTIVRPVSNESLESVIESAREVQKAAEVVCGSERRIIQWALDPSTKIVNPANGQVMTGTEPGIQQPAEQTQPPVAPSAPAQ